MSFPYFPVPQTSMYPVPYTNGHQNGSTMTLRHIFVFVVVIGILWYIGRVMGTFGLGVTGAQITVSVALLATALISQIMTKAPHVLGDYETFSIFTLGLLASLGTIFQLHFSLYGWRL